MRKLFSYLCILAGAGFVFAAGVVAGLNERNEGYAKVQADDFKTAVSASILEMQDFVQEYDMAPDYELDPGREMPVERILDENVIAQIEIPSQDLILPVGDEWNSRLGGKMPCRFRGSAYTDDLIIAGHSYRAHFRCLYDVKIGDDVILTDMDGNAFYYRVFEKQVISGNDLDGLLSGDWDLTLFTCTANSKGRVVMRCERITEVFA